MTERQESDVVKQNCQSWKYQVMAWKTEARAALAQHKENA